MKRDADEYAVPRGMAQEPDWRFGHELSPVTQREALARFVHRYTAEHVPAWARKKTVAFPNGAPLQFATDAEWLRNTQFAVKKNGTLDKRVNHCETGEPTWPNNPELRKI